MKTITHMFIGAALGALCALAPLTPNARAQMAASTPSPTALTNPVVSPAPSSLVAQSAARQMVMQTNMVAGNLAAILTDGVPARGGNPAATAYQVQQALGAGNFARLNAAIVDLGGAAVPAATPVPVATPTPSPTGLTAPTPTPSS